VSINSSARESSTNMFEDEEEEEVEEVGEDIAADRHNRWF